MIELRVLGALDVRDAGGTELHQLAVQPKLIALLTFLALAKPRGFHRRDKIVAYFWPELDQEHARASLRASLHRIRQALATDVILRRGNEELAIDPARLWCDARACEDALEANDVRAVQRLYRGQLLDSFFIPDAAPEFDQWLDEKRGDLARRVAALAAAGTSAFEFAPQKETADGVQARRTRRPAAALWLSVSAAAVFMAGAWWLLSHRAPRGSEAVGETRLEAGTVSHWSSFSGDNAQALTQHSVTMHPRRERLYIYGGRTGSLIRGEVWRIVLGDHGIANWDSVVAAGRHPAPRWGHSAVFDTSSSRMIVFGGALGHSSPCSNETWILVDPDGWNETPRWIKLEPRGAIPPARANHSGVYDERNNRLIIFGGHDCFTPRFADVWVLKNANGLGGAPEWQELKVPGGPSARVNHIAAYDAATNRMLVWGGSDVDQTMSSDVWVLENANGVGVPRWHKLKVRGASPDGQYGANAAYNSALHRLIVFGGSRARACSNDVWVLEHADGARPPEWHRLMTGAPAPEPRCVAASAYDSRDRLFIIGGEQGSGGIFADMWMLERASGN